MFFIGFNTMLKFIKPSLIFKGLCGFHLTV
jgi:hypothetical protein